MQKRILVLSEIFPPISGGSGRWFWELYSRLDPANTVVATNEHKNSADIDNKAPMHIERMRLSNREWGIKSVSGLLFYLKTLLKLRKLVKQHDIDEVHCARVIHEGVLAYLLSYITDINYICYVHGEDVETAATSGEHSLMVKHVCKRAQYIICNSVNSANIVKRLKFAQASKLHVLHPGVDANIFRPAPLDPVFRKRMGWHDKFVILTVGRLQKRKGQDMLIKAMPIILARHPDVHYAIVGSGECKDDLRALITSKGLRDNVALLDEIDDADMIKCYQQCQLFVLPNRTIDNDIEGFGMVLVEAQSCAKPVVAGDSGGTKETMLLNQSGIIVDCTDEQKIAEALCQLISAPEQLIKMGERGREHVVNELDWQAHVEKAKILFDAV